MKNIMVVQSGGPTAQINSTLYGIILEGLKFGAEKIYGAKFGLSGLLKKDVINLVGGGVNLEKLKLLTQTPSCCLGSCRKKLKSFKQDEKDYVKIVNLLKELDVGVLIYIGGNDSMDTANKLFEYFKAVNFNVSVVGAPKTIDNDLEKTDHCPGFGSAAKFVAVTFLELERDISVYSIPAVTLVEVMGRDAGWLVASSSLARLNGGKGPSLIYCCEKFFSFDEFFKHISECLKEKSVLVALSEGLKTSSGKLVSGLVETKEKGLVDEFGHIRNSGACRVLENFVKKNFGCKTRSIELSLTQRSAAHVSSLTDLKESIEVGKTAVKLAFSQESGIMVTIERVNNSPYFVNFGKVSLKNVANRIKLMPSGFITKAGNNITKEGEDYLAPLIKGEPEIKYENGLPQHFRFF